MCTQLLSCVQFFVTPWTVVCQAPLSVKFFKQEYWSGLPFPPPGNPPKPGIETSSPMSSGLAGGFFITAPPGKPKYLLIFTEIPFFSSTYLTGLFFHVRYYWASAAAKSLQLCLTLCDPIDGSPWGYPVPGILQARTLEWVAISFSNAWKWKVKVKSLSRVQFLATPWTAAHQAPPSVGFSRQECWSGVPLPSCSKFSLGFWDATITWLYCTARILTKIPNSKSLNKFSITNPGMEPRYPTLQANSLPSEPWGKPQWTWVWANSWKEWRGVWCAAVHGVTKSWTWLSNWTQQNKFLVAYQSTLPFLYKIFYIKNYF